MPVAVYDSEADYVDAVGDLIKKPKNRAKIVAELKKNTEFLHGKEKLAEYKTVTFGKLDKLRHEPQLLPFSDTLTQNEDVFLIKFNESEKNLNIQQF